MQGEHLRSRRMMQELLSDSFTPKAEKHQSQNGKITVSGNHLCILGTSPNITSLPPTRNVNVIGPEPLASCPESTSSRKEMKPNESIGSRARSTEWSSPLGAQLVGNVHQKWPVKLAPLDLPAETKEAQLKKLIDMKDEVFLDKKRHSHRPGASMKTLADRHGPVKGDPLNKVGLSEHKLPKLKDGISPAKDKMALKDSPSTIYALPVYSHEGASGLSMLKIKSGNVHNSVPKAILVNATDSQNVSIKGNFKYSRSQNASLSRSKPVKANGIAVDCAGQTSGTGQRKK